ncbi:unnamed protein product, partial [Durusdinium trenchii]
MTDPPVSSQAATSTAPWRNSSTSSSSPTPQTPLDVWNHALQAVAALTPEARQALTSMLVYYDYAVPPPMEYRREAMQMFQMFQMFQSLQGGGSGAGSPSAGNGANLLTNLQVFGNKGSVTMTPSPANRLTTDPPASPAKAATVAAHGESQTDSQEQSPKGLELVLPLTKQVISPEEQLSWVKTATAERQAAKEEAKQAEAAAEQPEKKGKAQAKGKAKAKGKSGAKAKASTKRQAETEEVSRPKAKAKASADRKIWSKEDPPPVPAPKSGTTWYRRGKIHRNSGAFRVFLNGGDRCDKKVKILDEENCGAEWQRALQLIDEAPEDVE